jgi:hypothetical protein
MCHAVDMLRPFQMLCVGSAAAALCGCQSYVMQPMQLSPASEAALRPGTPPTDCNADEAAGLSRCIQAGRIRQQVEELSRHPPGPSARQAAFRLCRQSLVQAGFEVAIENYPNGRNLIGSHRGVTDPTKFVLLSARYDHSPGCNGANDPGSGLAALLETARVLATGRFAKSLRVACWGSSKGERSGSRFHARGIRERGEHLHTAVVLASLGYATSKPNSQQLPTNFERWFPDAALGLLDRDYRGDFLMLASDESATDFVDRFAKAAKARQHPSLQLRLTARMLRKAHPYRYDQQSFWNEGLAAVLLTDTGPFRQPNYRCRNGADHPNHLNYRFVAASASALVATAAQWLDPR